jgi:hypothetical protein
MYRKVEWSYLWHFNLGSLYIKECPQIEIFAENSQFPGRFNFNLNLDSLPLFWCHSKNTRKKNFFRMLHSDLDIIVSILVCLSLLRSFLKHFVRFLMLSCFIIIYIPRYSPGIVWSNVYHFLDHYTYIVNYICVQKHKQVLDVESIVATNFDSTLFGCLIPRFLRKEMVSSHFFAAKWLKVSGSRY